VAAEIKEATGVEVKLIAGGGGIYEVRRDGEVLWKKTQSGVFPKPGEAAALFA
jgi:predicted Rdx family selenoprotein